MNFDQYQEDAMTLAVYPNRGQGNLWYPGLGLAGESGEAVDQIKKVYRDDAGRITKDRKEKLVLEMGDVLWYLAAMATELGVDLSHVAAKNMEKLRARKAANTIHGDGDNR